MPEGTADAGGKTVAHDFVDVLRPEQRERGHGDAADAKDHHGFPTEVPEQKPCRQRGDQPAQAFGGQDDADEARLRRTEGLCVEREGWE